jgi:ABC-type glycerol-3-phosphate transport system substrate-binding protein
VFPSEAAHYLGFAREFEKQHGVRINLIAQSYTDILRVLQAEAQAGPGRGTLDLVELDLAMLGQARASARDLDSLVTPEVRVLFPDAAWQVAGNRGHIRFVPHRLMWEAMIYNRLKVPHPPATWDELAAFARAHPGKIVLKAARYEGAICDIMPFVWAAGGDELDPQSAGSIRALSYLRRLGLYLNPDSAVLREMSVAEAQARGEVWIHFNWPFAMGYLAGKGLAPSVNLSAPIPSGPDGAATPLGGGYLAIPISAPHLELASAFLKFLLTPESQRRLSRQLGWYGSVAPEPGSPEALLYSGFTAMRSQVRARPTIGCYAQLSNSWQQAIRQVLLYQAAPTEAAALVAQADFHKTGVGGDAQSCECR